MIMFLKMFFMKKFYMLHLIKINAEPKHRFLNFIDGIYTYRFSIRKLHQHTTKMITDSLKTLRRYYETGITRSYAFRIEQLKKFKEQDVNNEIVAIIIRTAGHLNLQQAKKIAEKMYNLGEKEPAINRRIDLFMQQFKKKSKWEKSKIYLILLVTIIISLLIYLGSR